MNINYINFNLYDKIDNITNSIPNFLGHFDTLTIFYVINTIIVFTIVFLEFQKASSSWAWILVLLLLPYMGLVLYLLLGRPIYREKIFPLSKDDKIKFQQKLLGRKAPYIINSEELAANNHINLIKLNFQADQSFLSDNNDIDIIINGEEKFQLLFEDIKNAKKYVYIQYYILKKDNIGKKLFKLLEKKVKEGVEVYVLYDDIGSRTLNWYTLKDIKSAGIKTKSFFKARFALINMRMNYRNHRKLVVIDGQIGYTGGFNVGDEYLGNDNKVGNWRDTHLRIKGEAVSLLTLRFINDWNSQVLKNNKSELIKFSKYHINKYPILNNKNPIQIVTSGPDNRLEQIKYGYLHIINRAKKYLYIQSPYFVPDESTMDALKISILSGVDVRIMIPAKPDHMLVHWANYSYVGELARMGAKIYEYTDGFLHAKTIIADDEVTSVGSANFDNRSFKLNFEVNAFIYDKETTKKFKDIFEKDIKNSLELTSEIYSNRGFIIKMKEAISRLTSPIL
ncbi:cardiolipin synthase [Gemelliphila palaticanis]|uniref:Cardiolipin synthase n=1 Tax=Gemelliphila palaticanis TaxID=81950 RepID=A0ABX2T3B8_9BACL|nr:cardiolipin synthase [Gemella palaticanis]MBF0715795.1 cardiolipin synthase [Gemella palaticanis]NYS47725.1 cardiolipin synthase [Gemella palaticanis]